MLYFEKGGDKMLDKSDLQAIAQLMDEKFRPVNERLDSIDKRLSNVEEDTKITRNAVNDLIEWADDASIQIVPLFKKSK